MIESIKKGLVAILRETADKIDAGNSELDEEQAIELMKVVTHTPMSKEEAAIYLDMCTSRFDTLIRTGFLPKGRKKLGHKEKVWYKDEIDNCLAKYRKKTSNK